MRGMTRMHTVVRVLTGMAAAVALAACGPAGSQSAGQGTPTRSSSTAPSTPEAPISESPSPTATTAPPTTTPPPGTTAPAAKPHTTAPRVRHTTAAPRPHPTTAAPRPHRTTAPPTRSAVCGIRSNAGNCYRAGQFCRNADLGRSTTDASGRRITCRMVSGRPHWQY